MSRVFGVAFAAMIVAGCSGVQGTMASIGQSNGGPSNVAADQNDCQDRYSGLGPGAILDCRLEKARRRREAAAAGAQTQ